MNPFLFFVHGRRPLIHASSHQEQQRVMDKISIQTKSIILQL
jgi:hypothetical protein